MRPPAGPAKAGPASDSGAAGRREGAAGPGERPASLLEVRIGPNRLDVVEYYSQGHSVELRRALRRLGLLLESEFDSPCG